MGTVYVFFADGFEEIEAFTSVDVMRRAGLNVEMITVTPDEIVKGAHGVPVLCDKNIVNCDFFDADLILLPGGMPGAATLEKCDDLRRLILRFAEENKPIAAICAAPMVLGKLGLLKGKKATCYPGLNNIWRVPTAPERWWKKTAMSLQEKVRALPWSLLWR